MHRFAVLVAARNEEAVIGQLIESIQMQDYPSELVDVYVVADNCDDSTASVAREKGAFVYERFNKVHVGKGYAFSHMDFVKPLIDKGSFFSGYRKQCCHRSYHINVYF